VTERFLNFIISWIKPIECRIEKCDHFVLDSGWLFFPMICYIAYSVKFLDSLGAPCKSDHLKPHKSLLYGKDILYFPVAATRQRLKLAK
jgi:hypothetical protein